MNKASENAKTLRRRARRKRKRLKEGVVYAAGAGEPGPNKKAKSSEL